MKNQHKQMSRREMLKAMGLMGAGAYIGALPLMSQRAFAQDQYAGITIRMLTQGGTAYEAFFQAYGDIFAEQTGATVEFEFAPWESLMPKVQADLASGSPAFDLFCNDIEFQYTIWPSLEPINDFLDASDYDMEGFFNPIYRYGEGIAGNEGVRFGLPVTSGVSMNFYRTDLIDEFPTTWEGYEALLAEFTNDDMYGVSFAGAPAQLVKLFLARYWRLGKPLMTPDWQPLINGAEGVEAMETLKRHATEYAPPGTLAWDNPDAANAFLAGDVAVHEGWSSFILPSLEDEEKSNVVGNWAIAPYPEGGTGNFVQHNIVMLNTSQNKQAAFDLMALLTNPESIKVATLDYGITPARETIFSDEDVIAAEPSMPQIAAVLNNGKPFTPGVPQWLEMFIGVAEAASAVLADQATAQDALDDLAGRWVELIEQNPLDFEYNE